MGWGGFLDQLMQKLPIQTRKERWRNQIDQLTKKREKLLRRKCDVQTSIKIRNIDDRIDKLNRLLKNN